MKFCLVTFNISRMDVHRSIGAVTPEALAEGSSSAVEALHKSLVAMRKEIAKKNKGNILKCA